MGSKTVKRRTVAYVRVSSRGQNVASQVDAIAHAAKARGDKIDHVYREKLTARTIDRPVLAELRAAAKAGDVAKLYVFRIDRLTRSGIRDTFQVVEELRAHGVELVTIADGFALHGPGSEMVLAALAWCASEERKAISDRISAGIARLRKQGKNWGRQPSMGPSDRRRAIAMHDAGRTTRQIAVALKFTHSVVARCVREAAKAHAKAGSRASTSAAIVETRTTTTRKARSTHG
jgi:DNA invertase Pin-like site-specific DNA recombinase